MSIDEILGLVFAGLSTVGFMCLMRPPFRTKIVKFKDGTYGIRKWTFEGYRFKDLDGSGTPNSFWWSRNGEYGRSCKGSLEHVTKVYDSIDDKGTPVKDRYPPTNLNGKMYE